MAKAGKRVLGKLSAREVATAKDVGRYSDGGGLYLDIAGDGRRRWLFMFNQGLTSSGRVRRVEMGLGSARDVSLAEARSRAEDARRKLRDGINPIEDREAPKRTPTFWEVAEEVLASVEASGKNDKHRQQWRNTLETYCKPIHNKPVDAVTTSDIASILGPIWQSKAETASRLRGRIERVLSVAKAKGHRSGDNPAAWRDCLEPILGKRQRLTRGHHAAIPFEDVPAFMVELRKNGAISALALEFTILTAARTGEVLGARWEEIDLEKAIWTVPASRMKAGKEHRVPLSAGAVEILKNVEPLQAGSFVFPGAARGREKGDGSKGGKPRPLSIMALAMVLRRMERESITVHGFRSAFRDWAAECTNFPHEVCEMALAHTIPNKAEAAYRRGDLFEKRRKLMEAWASHCEAPRGANIVALRREA